jgi:hypothetical protein
MMKLKSFIEVSLLIGGILFSLAINAQELYVFTEPASNMPAKSLSVKGTARIMNDLHKDRFMQRYTPEVMFGLNKNWMVHGAVTFSDMLTSHIRWESARVYAKYRFLSNDDVHRHFRMATFAELSYSRNNPMFNELSFEGDQSGLQAGLIATQLWHKLAVSGTASYLLYAGEREKTNPQSYPYQAVNYSFSAGFLLLPVHYTSFKQTNVNLYAELLGQRSLDLKGYYVDFAPAIQLIFNSNAKLNVGYRYQIGGDMSRMSQRGWLISFERTFLNALK